jgi:hypothetical protein
MKKPLPTFEPFTTIPVPFHYAELLASARDQTCFANRRGRGGGCIRVLAVLGSLLADLNHRSE